MTYQNFIKIVFSKKEHQSPLFQAIEISLALAILLSITYKFKLLPILFSHCLIITLMTENAWYSQKKMT